MATVTPTKTCTKCGQEKPVDAFHKHRNTKDGRYPQCAECKNARSAGYYQKWTPEQREKHRARVLRCRYGMDLDLLIALYEKQEGCCAICGRSGDRPAINEKRKSSRGVLCVDHDHATGEVRGLLCRNCNIGLGKFREDTANLVRAAAYLHNRGGQ